MTTPPPAEPGGGRGKSAAKHEAILEAALQLFVERGFHGTAVPAVAKRAGVSTGTIYNYFDSKEALVNALFRHYKQAIAVHVYTHFPAIAGPREQFRAMWTYMADFAMKNPAAFAFLELHQHASYLDDESRAIEHQLHEFGEGFVAQAQVMKLVKPIHPKLLMELIFGAFIGVMRAHWEGRITLTDESLRETEEACWDAIALPPSP